MLASHRAQPRAGQLPTAPPTYILHPGFQEGGMHNAGTTEPWGTAQVHFGRFPEFVILSSFT